MHAFPVNLHEEYEDDEGNVHTRPARDQNGNPVLAQEAVDLRDALVEKLASMPPIGAALDQILHHFGHDDVAEVTGRSRRVLRISDDGRGDRLAVRNRPASANLHETQAFMDGKKCTLVFSGAGNTGRSYHSDLACVNTKRRRHYLLEADWQANQAIQGLGRTHRTRQKSAPLFSPVTTNVKGERRFTSTIARRIHSLGAITRGQKDSQSGMGDDNAALFREADNFESEYATAALRAFYRDLCAGRIEDWSADTFEEETGLVDHRRRRPAPDRPPAHAHLPQPPAGARDRRAEPPVRAPRAARRRQHRRGHPGRHVQPRRRAHHRGRSGAGGHRDGRGARRGPRRPRRDTPARPAEADHRRDGPRDLRRGERLPGSRGRPAAQHAIGQRRALHGGALADARGRHDPKASAHHPARQPPDRTPGQPQDRMEADRDRRVASGVGPAVRGAARVPRVPLLARDGGSAADLEEAPGNRRPRLPPHDRLRNEPDRQGPDGRPDGRPRA